MEGIDNCELMFSSWSIRIRRQKTSTGKVEEVKKMKTILSGIEIVTS